MARFIDSRGDAWTIQLDLGLCRRLARTVSIDVMNPSDYQTLICSVSARLEYAFAACSDRATELGVNDLNEFGRRLGDAATDCSDALQEALITFYQSLGQTELRVQAEANLKVMKAARQPAEELMQQWESMTEKHLQQMRG